MHFKLLQTHEGRVSKQSESDDDHQGRKKAIES